MKKISRITYAEFYYLAIAIYVLANNIQLSYAYTQWAASGSAMLMILKLLRYISYALCIIRFFFLRKVDQAFIWIGVFLLCGAIVASVTGTANSPIFYFMFFLAGIKTDFKKIVKIFIAVQTATFLLYVFCGLTGIAGGGIIHQTGRTRAFLGYGWVNRASYCLLFITIELLYIVDVKLSLLPAVIIMVLNCFVYFKTKTLFPFVITAGVLIIGLVSNYSWRRVKHSASHKGRILSVYYITTILLSILFPVIYKPENRVWYLINKAVTGRLELAQKAIQKYGLHIWGNKLEWVGASTLQFGLSQSKEYFYVDAGFLNLALEFGILFVGAVAFMYYKSVCVARKKGNVAMLTCLFVLFTLFVFEPYVIDFSFNPFILYYITTLGSEYSIFRHLFTSKSDVAISEL